MVDMASLAEVRAEREELAALASELTAAVAQPEPVDPVALFQLRHKFGQMLIRHLKHEDWVLYPEVMAGPDAAAAAVARQLHAETVSLSEVFYDYGRRWTGAAIAADWAGFCRETKEILRAVHKRATREETELLPRIDPAPAASPRRSAA